MVLPSGGRGSNKGEVGEISRFLALNVNISKRLGDTAKVTILITNRKSHNALSIDTKIDNLG